VDELVAYIEGGQDTSTITKNNKKKNKAKKNKN
jgi:hypothetical protein